MPEARRHQVPQRQTFFCTLWAALERCSLPEHERLKAGHGGIRVERMGSGLMSF